MNRWFRIYDEAGSDPKIQKLPLHLFKAWFNLLCLANKAGNGVLPSISDIAYHLRLSDTDAQAAVDELILAGLIDITPDKKLVPHNWEARQAPSDSSRERTKKWRAGKVAKQQERHGDGDVTVGDGHRDGLDQTRPEEDTDTEPDQTRDPREGMVVLNEILSGSVGAQADSKISVEAKRTVCLNLGLADCDEIVRRFIAWPNRQPPRTSIDAQFIACAKKIFDGMPDHMRAKLSLEEPESQRLPPVKPSSSLKQLIGD